MIANGKVYLASFGTRNTGSGQLCVYGLLPDGPAPPAPSDLRALADQAQVDLSWTPSKSAATYDVKKSEGGGEFEPVATGLTTTAFCDIAVMRGEKYTYRVTAVNANGESGDSAAASVTIAGPRQAEHPH